MAWGQRAYGVVCLRRSVVDSSYQQILDEEEYNQNVVQIWQGKRSGRRGYPAVPKACRAVISSRSVLPDVGNRFLIEIP